jgi:hypothetical protein
MFVKVHTDAFNDSQHPYDPHAYAGGKMKTGRVLDYSKAQNRQLCRRYLSKMDKMGRRERSFGDATEPLAEV